MAVINICLTCYMIFTTVHAQEEMVQVRSCSIDNGLKYSYIFLRKATSLH